MDYEKKILSYFIVFMMYLFCGLNAKLQAQTISGSVVDGQTNETLPGTNIVVKGTQIGTSADSEGSFSLDVPSLNDTLLVSFIGYQTKEVPILGRTTLEISIQSSAFIGEDLVVTAFGVEREERSLSYSTESIDTESLTEARDLNVMNSLQGKVAGIDIHSGGSGLGSDTRVILRGNRSISGDSQPLYVVDGVPIRGNPGTLNPDNIRSMNVLKGPNAAALYGEEAQDGAIIIETVKAKAGEVDVSFNNTFMARDPIHYMDFQYKYGQGNGGIYEKSSEKSWGPRMEDQMVAHWSLDPEDEGKQYALTPQPNTKKDFYQRGYNMASNIRAMLGGEKTQSVFSYTLTRGAGVIPTNELRRHNVMMRVNSQLTDNLSLDSKLDYSNQLIDNPIAQGRSNFNPNRQIYRTPPNIRTEHLSNFEYTDANGLNKQNWYNPGTTTGSNPYWMLYRNIQKDIEERTIAMASLTYDFSEDVSLLVRGSYDGVNNRGEEKEYNDTFTRADFGRYTVTRGNALQYVGDFLLSFQQDFTEDWHINANFGGSLEKEENSLSNMNTDDALLIPNFFTMSNTSRPSASFDPGVEVERQSLYASANIGWRDEIYLDITGRNDWSSTLPADSRSYFYPSIGLSAILSDLIPAFPDYFSFAKMRISWAKVGSSAPAYMGFRSANFEPGGNNGYLSLGNVLPNPDLKPEKTESYEIGLNVRFFENRLGLDATAYKTNTYNQLFTIALPIVSGAESFFTNGGDVQNKGIELSLTTVPMQTSSFNWDFDINFSLNNS